MKKALSLLLVVAMLMTFGCLSASAEGNENEGIMPLATTDSWAGNASGYYVTVNLIYTGTRVRGTTDGGAYSGPKHISAVITSQHAGSYVTQTPSNTGYATNAAKIDESYQGIFIRATSVNTIPGIGFSRGLAITA